MTDERPKIKGVVYQHNKKTGLTYAYENHPYYDKKTKKRKAKRKLIGRYDPETRTIIPTDGRMKKKDSDKKSSGSTGSASDDLQLKIFYEELLAQCKNADERITALEKEVARLEKIIEQS